MKFGADFNASRPTDGDFTRSPDKRQMAVELRDLKQRIVDFFGGTVVGSNPSSFDFSQESNSHNWPFFF